jgi:hypothetical protein
MEYKDNVMTYLQDLPWHSPGGGRGAQANPLSAVITSQ